jgi:GcrA cell cycle regulator
MSWTAERVETLKKLVAENWSSGAIAREFGVTRNTIIGKLHRMGMSTQIAPGSGKASEGAITLRATRRAKGNPTGVKGVRGAVRKAAVVLKPVELPRLEDAPPSLDVPFLSLPRKACQWPASGAGLTLLCCGNPTAHHESMAPYCAYHLRLAYTPRPERKKT